jgi:hypothetical protein
VVNIGEPQPLDLRLGTTPERARLPLSDYWILSPVLVPLRAETLFNPREITPRTGGGG